MSDTLRRLEWELIHGGHKSKMQVAREMRIGVRSLEILLDQKPSLRKIINDWRRRK